MINKHTKNKKLFAVICSLLSALCSLLIGCAEPYGKLGGADKTGAYRTRQEIAGVIDRFRGVWYSHYGAIRLDSYRIGKWGDIQNDLGTGKLNLFPGFDPDAPLLHDGYTIDDDDYYIFYDDTVYGQSGGGVGGNGGWDNLVTRYIGIVRAVNIFNDDPDTGAVVIEYLDGCYPGWSPEVLNTPLPFFGVYYRVLNSNCVQMANAVDLAALMAGKKYYTETATLEEAITKNNASNDGEFISWGIVIPQDRE
jgi:hypothetical protein